MPKEKNKTLRLGILVSLGLILFIVAIYFLGSRQNLFSSVIHVKTAFKDVRGVVSGNKVRFNGLNVGNVENIEIISDSVIMIELAVKKQYAKFIYKNSLVEIGQEGLMGSKLIFLSKGTPNTGPIEEDDLLLAKEGIDIEAMLMEAREVVLETKSVATNLNAIAQKMNSGNGDFGALLNEKTITPRLNATADQLFLVSKNANQITQKINNGNGDLSKLLNNSNLTKEAQQILTHLNNTSKTADSAVYQLNMTTRSINDGNGVINRLIYDKNLANKVDTAVSSVDDGVKQIIKTAKAIEDSWIIRLFSKKKKTPQTADTTNKK